MPCSVYALKSSHEPLQVRYIGATSQPLEVRLHQHLTNPGGNPAKQAWISSVLEQGEKVLIEPLSVGLSAEQAKIAESRWTVFWSHYCELLNNSHCSRYPLKRGRRVARKIDFPPLPVAVKTPDRATKIDPPREYCKDPTAWVLNWMKTNAI